MAQVQSKGRRRAYILVAYGLHAQAVSMELLSVFNCCPVFLGKELKEEYYKGIVLPFCDPDLPCEKSHCNFTDA